MELPPVEQDNRILKEDYCNYDLIARCWNDEYRGRIWKNKERIADFEGSSLDDIMAELHTIVDDLQQKKRKIRGGRKPGAKDIADAIRGIEHKLSRAQKMMLVLHGKALNHRLAIKAISRLGDYSSAEAAFADYVVVARRVCDELAYRPAAKPTKPTKSTKSKKSTKPEKKQEPYPCAGLFFQEDIAQGSVSADTMITLRPEILAALQILTW